MRAHPFQGAITIMLRLTLLESLQNQEDIVTKFTQFMGMIPLPQSRLYERCELEMLYKRLSNWAGSGSQGRQRMWVSTIG